MLNATYIDNPVKPFDVTGVKPTKGVYNFLCDWLYHDGLIVSYVPHQDIAASPLSLMFSGGRVVEFNAELSRFVPVNPAYKINLRIINALYNAGWLVARPELKSPDRRITLFSWSKELIDNRREVMRSLIIGGDGMVTNAKLQCITDLYGVKPFYVNSKGAFEIIRADNSEAIERGKSSRTWVLANDAGEPVFKLNNMSLKEWEAAMYSAAKRANTLTKNIPPQGYLGYFSRIKVR